MPHLSTLSKARAVLLVVALCVPLAANSPRIVAAATADQVEQSLDRAKAFLYSKQQKDGTWELDPRKDPGEAPWAVTGGQWGGLTALTVFSLLNAGEKPQDTRLAPAIDFLK